MGYNTTVVVMNDALDTIAKDADFGRKLVDAILALSVKSGPIDISAQSGGMVCANAARAIESHHADNMVAVMVGLNDGQKLANMGNVEILGILKGLARQIGFRLTKIKWPTT